MKSKKAKKKEPRTVYEVIRFSQVFHTVSLGLFGTRKKAEAEADKIRKAILRDETTVYKRYIR